MKNKKKIISKNKLFIVFMLFVLLFSIFKVGRSIAATDSFKITNAEVTEESETAEVNNISFKKTKITRWYCRKNAILYE